MGKFAERNSYGYCVRCSGKFPHNVYSEVLSKVVACQHVVYEFQIKIFPRFSEHRRGF